jgi:hypothetical protein
MLAAVIGMHFKPEDRNAPYGPMMVMADGSRTAIPEDFRGEPVAVLAHMAERAHHPLLRARLCDVSWLIERKRYQLASLAASAYVETIKGVQAGSLYFHKSSDEAEELGHDTAELLRRALQIAYARDRNGPEAASARDLAVALRTEAISRRAIYALHRFSDLDLDFALSDPAAVAADIESVLLSGEGETDPHSDRDLWRLAARGYHLAKKDADEHRCRLAAADCQVAQADRMGSAMLASHWLSAAIAELHGLPNQTERRRTLRHRLVDTQVGVPEEMSVFSHSIDMSEIVKQVREAMQSLSLADMLFAFAGLAESPDPNKLAEKAREAIREHPLASIFEASLMDSEGKVIHRAPGSDFSGKASDPAVARQISQNERLRRQLVAHGELETARLSITDKHYISDDTFRGLLEFSPFVPSDLVGTFAHGFSRFFQGDFTSALYILVPLLENSLRYVLKQHDIDVTKFDDASQTQEDRTITSMFDQMREDLDRVFSNAIATDIENVFLSKLGPALRHGVAHGLLHDGSPFSADAIYACWLIFRLCLIPLFPHRSQIGALVPL